MAPPCFPPSFQPQLKNNKRMLEQKLDALLKLPNFKAHKHFHFFPNQSLFFTGNAQLVKCSGKFAKIAKCKLIFHHRVLRFGKQTGLYGPGPLEPGPGGNRCRHNLILQMALYYYLPPFPPDFLTFLRSCDLYCNLGLTT